MDAATRKAKLQELQQNKNENIARASIMKNYLETLESISAKENTENILKEVEKKVDEDTDFFKRLAEEYQEIQEEIEQKVTLLEETNNKRKDLNAQLEQLSKDLANNESYINKEKKEETANRISELKEEMNNLQARQGEIVSDLIMLVSRAHQAALDGEMVSILNKIKAVKEALLQKTFMEIPEDSIQDEVAKAIEERQTFYNQISGKNYELSGLSAADERIEELNERMRLIANQNGLSGSISFLKSDRQGPPTARKQKEKLVKNKPFSCQQHCMIIFRKMDLFNCRIVF